MTTQRDQGDGPSVPFGALPWAALLARDDTVVAATGAAVAVLGADPTGRELAGVLASASALGLDPVVADGRAGATLVALDESGQLARLAAIVDAIADSAFFLDATGALLWRSPALIRRAGALPEEVVAERSPVERVHPEDMPAVLESFAGLVATPGARRAIEVRSRSVTDDDVFERIEVVGTNCVDVPAIGGLVIQVRNLGDGQRVVDLAHAEGELHSLAEAVPVGVLLGDPSGRIVYRNSAARTVLGDAIASLDRDDWMELIRPEHRDALRALIDGARSGSSGGDATVSVYRIDPASPHAVDVGWIRLRLAPLLGTDAVPLGVIATIEDVTAQVEARAETERLTQMLDASSDFVVVWRPPTGETLWANEVTREMLDVPLPDGSPRHLGDLLEPAERDRFVREATATLESSDVWHGELTLLHPRRGGVPVSATGVVRRAEDRTIDTVALVARDISDLKIAEERLRHLANHDTLTGLPNRALLTDHLAAAAARHRRSHGGLAVVFIDLDGFKEVNDRMGHVVGDVVLTEVARRLGTAIRDVDVVARVGGDEFVVVCEDVTVEVIDEVAARLVAAVVPPVLAGGETIRLSCSAGVALVAQGSEADPDRLLRVADEAMYAAKAAGRDRHVVTQIS